MAYMRPLGFCLTLEKHFCEPQSHWICLITISLGLRSRGFSFKDQSKKQDSMLGKCPEKGSPDPETPLGMGGVFVLFVQVLWGRVWILPKAEVSPGIVLPGDHITQLMQVGLLTSWLWLPVSSEWMPMDIRACWKIVDAYVFVHFGSYKNKHCTVKDEITCAVFSLVSAEHSPTSESTKDSN